jgi:hypothetical protein
LGAADLLFAVRGIWMNLSWVGTRNCEPSMGTCG